MTNNDHEYEADSFDAGDSESVKKRQKKYKLLDQKRDDGFRLLLENENGRAWINGLLEHCKVFHQTYAGNSNQTCFNEGVRSIGLKIMADIARVDPDKILTLFKENGDSNV